MLKNISEFIENRIKINGTNPRALSLAAGLTHCAVHELISGKTKSPSFKNMNLILEALNCRLEIITPENDSIALSAPKKQITPSRNVELRGLTPCGGGEWFEFDHGRIQAKCPPDLEDPDAFAVITKGESLQPFGIWPGFLCFCSPNTKPNPGDICMIERIDGLTTLKKFASDDGLVQIFVEYSNSTENYAGITQKLFELKMDKNMIHRLSVVMHIITRPVFR